MRSAIGTTSAVSAPAAALSSSAVTWRQSRSRPTIFGQMPNQFADVSKRAQRHDCWDDERLRQPLRPVWAGHALKVPAEANGTGANCYRNCYRTRQY